MPSPHGKNNACSLHPALELIYLAMLEPDQASQSLRKHLLSNPNYFDSLTENSFRIVLNINGDTDYESLGCVRYIPLLDRVYASINVKQAVGYSFRVDPQSSREYVRFYLSYDRGASWQDKGTCAANVVDEPGAKARTYLITRKVGLLDDLIGSEEVVLVRAILSWNSSPPAGAPDWIPLWGQVAESQIRVGYRDTSRTDIPRADSRIKYADESASRAGLGLSPFAADGRPAETLTSAGLLQTEAPSRIHVCR